MTTPPALPVTGGVVIVAGCVFLPVFLVNTKRCLYSVVSAASFYSDFMGDPSGCLYSVV